MEKYQKKKLKQKHKKKNKNKNKPQNTNKNTPTAQRKGEIRSTIAKAFVISYYFDIQLYPFFFFNVFIYTCITNIQKQNEKLNSVTYTSPPPPNQNPQPLPQGT